MGYPPRPINAQQENVIRAEARGERHADILLQYYGIPPEASVKEKHRAELCMARLRKRPEYQQIWNDELRARVRRRLPGAVSRIDNQIDNDNDWVANKAANDYIGLAKTLGVIGNEEEKAIRVQIEGLPDIGTPDSAEEDV